MALKEEDYLTIKNMLKRGIPGRIIASNLKYGSQTISNARKANSYEEFKEFNRRFSEKQITKRRQPKITDITEDAPKTNEIILSKLEIMGTPHEISLFYQLAKKCGIESKLQMNAK